MFSFQKLLVLIGLLIIAQRVMAQNTDILWQKTLTKDSIPISSIAIAEGKYVAVLKGDEIVILDYMTGDSIKAFAKPSDMVGNDIILGKNGERLYVLINNGYLRSWDIFTCEKLNDINMQSKSTQNGTMGNYGAFKSFALCSSLDGKYIVVGSTLEITYGPAYYGNGSSKLLNTEDFTFSFQDCPYPTTYNFGGEEKNPQGSGILSLSFSPSGNYLLRNEGDYFITKQGHGDIRSVNYEGCFISLSSKLISFKYGRTLPKYIVSSSDDFLLSGNNLTDIPPVHFFRSLTKTGFIFLPDDNHMLAFKAAGGVAAISNIEKDTWEKVYQGDSLTENTIQTNASRSAFVTATSNRITLWKIPDTLQAASLTADFIMSSDSIPIFDSITFSNRTFPMKRGTSFEWNFGDGTTTNEIYPVHKFLQAGKFTVTLNVWDTLGRTSTISKMVSVHTYKIPDKAIWINRINHNPINCISYSSDGQLITSGSGNSALVWQPQNGNLLKNREINLSVNSVIFTNEGNIAISSIYFKKYPNTSYYHYTDQYESDMSIWNFNLDTVYSVFYWHPVFNNNLQIKYFDIKYYSFVSDMSSDNKWYITGHCIIADWSDYDNPNSVDFKKHFYSNKHIGNQLSYNFDSKTSKYFPSPVTESTYSYPNSVISSSPPIFSLKISPTNKEYVSIVESKSNSRFLLLKDLTSDNFYRQIPTTATSMHFSPNKYHLLTNTGLWDIYDSILVQAVDLPTIFEYHPDGIHVFTLRADSTIGIYNLNTNSYEYIFKQPTTFTALAVAPDG
ncbi:MAG: PKD domain-containing protein, partial [Ignavibacteriae bacterium]|nr:PKD domain-containing protein [Ignavibacteriota bacterium]